MSAIAATQYQMPREVIPKLLSEDELACQTPNVLIFEWVKLPMQEYILRKLRVIIKRQNTAHTESQFDELAYSKLREIYMHILGLKIEDMEWASDKAILDKIASIAEILPRTILLLGQPEESDLFKEVILEIQNLP